MNIIFDLDGTLADCEHRRHLVTKDRKDPQWDEFFLRCVDDVPIRPMIELFWAFSTDVRVAHDIQIWTGRVEAVRKQTLWWLLDHVTARTSTLKRMRPDGCYWPDEELKEYWLRESIDMGWRPDLVFDDRKKVVDMWRRNGIMCVQVAEGNF